MVSIEKKANERGSPGQEDEVSAGAAEGSQERGCTARTCFSLSEPCDALFAADDLAEGREALDEVLWLNRGSESPDVDAFCDGCGRQRSSWRHL